jgi:hypothetical protein
MEAIKSFYMMIIRMLAAWHGVVNMYFQAQTIQLVFTEIIFFIEGSKPRKFASNAQIVVRG